MQYIKIWYFVLYSSYFDLYVYINLSVSQNYTLHICTFYLLVNGIYSRIWIAIASLIWEQPIKSDIDK